MSVNITNKGAVALGTKETTEGHVVEVFPSKKHSVPLYSEATTFSKGTNARIWTFSKNKLVKSIDSAQVLKIPDDANAVAVFLTMYYLATGADTIPYADTDSVELWGYEESSDGLNLNPCCLIANKLLVGPMDYSEEVYKPSQFAAYRSVTVESVVYKEFPLVPIILPSCGFRYVAPLFMGTKQENTTLAGNIAFIKMWQMPIFKNYIGEGLF